MLIFGLGAVCRMAGIQGVIVVKNSACVCIRAAHSVPSHLSARRFLPILFGLKRALCASHLEALMQL